LREEQKQIQPKKERRPRPPTDDDDFFEAEAEEFDTKKRKKGVMTRQEHELLNLLRLKQGPEITVPTNIRPQKPLLSAVAEHPQQQEPDTTTTTEKPQQQQPPPNQPKLLPNTEEEQQQLRCNAAESPKEEEKQDDEPAAENYHEEQPKELKQLMHYVEGAYMSTKRAKKEAQKAQNIAKDDAAKHQPEGEDPLKADYNLSNDDDAPPQIKTKVSRRGDKRGGGGGNKSKTSKR